MSKLVLWKEAQPFVLNQKWGVYDPKTYKQFGFTNHNGIDIAHGYNSRLRAPFPFQVYRTLWQPKGGGLVLSILSQYEYDGPDGKPAHVIVDYMHLAKYVKTQGQGDTGELLAIAGDTGFSTGPHTHIGYRWVRQKGTKWMDVEKNNANNTFDPLPFYTAGFAVDYRPEKPLVEPEIVPMDVLAVQNHNKAVANIHLVPEEKRPYFLEMWTKALDAFFRSVTRG